MTYHDVPLSRTLHQFKIGSIRLKHPACWPHQRAFPPLSAIPSMALTSTLPQFERTPQKQPTYCVVADMALDVLRCLMQPCAKDGYCERGCWDCSNSARKPRDRAAKRARSRIILLLVEVPEKIPRENRLDPVPEWLRGPPRKRLRFSRVRSNRTGVEFFAFSLRSLQNVS